MMANSNNDTPKKECEYIASRSSGGELTIEETFKKEGDKFCLV